MYTSTHPPPRYLNPWLKVTKPNPIINPNPNPVTGGWGEGFYTQASQNFTEGSNCLAGGGLKSNLTLP